MSKSKLIFYFLYLSYYLPTYGQVESVGDQTFTFIKDSSAISLPIFCNMNLNQTNNEVENAIIVIHGMARNAYDYFESVNSINSELGLDNRSMIIAPQFLINVDMGTWNLDSTIAFWSGTSSWLSGNLSNSTEQAPRDFEVSSFTIIDSLIHYLVSNFINIERVTLVGNSAGGQLVNRYAAGSGMHYNHLVDYVVAAPSSFVYLDENRYDSPFPFSWNEPSTCQSYNDYKYGLNDLNDYMESRGVDSIRLNYFAKKVSYLVGENDYGGTTDCSSMTQGDNRLARSIIYYNYLKFFYGPEVSDRHRLAIIPNMSHSHFQIFNSLCGRSAIFGTGGCYQFDDLTNPLASFSLLNNAGNYPLNVEFIDQSIQGTHPISYYIWKVNNETILSEGNITYTLDYPGIYDVSLVAIDNIGLVDSMLVSSAIVIDTLHGDVDMNAAVTSNDATEILNGVVGNLLLNDIQKSVGDVSSNGSINSLDASLVLQLVEGSIESLPVHGPVEYNGNAELQSYNISGQEGDIISIPISFVNVDSVYGFKIMIEYDQDLLESGTIYPTNSAASLFMLKTSISDSGTIAIAGASPIPINSEQVLFNLYFILGLLENEATTITCAELMINEIIKETDFNIPINPSLNSGNSLLAMNFGLDQNYPNPFNSSTSIGFVLDRDMLVSIRITDINGRLVKTLFKGSQLHGKHVIKWDGKDNSGLDVRSGIYFYSLSSGQKQQTRKMLILQ